MRTLTLTALLLATTALAAPAWAQTTAQTQPGGLPGAPQTPAPTEPAGPTPEAQQGQPEAVDPNASDAAQAAAEPEQATEVGEIVVLGRFIPEPLRATSEVVSVLTTEDLQRQGDDNAASALTRVSGLSLVQGRFVYVRGLGERYSSALLNGSPLPSPEPLQRVVPLDLFPSNVLASANVQKTYSAQYPGEFGGGVIDLRTLSLPTERFFTFSVSTGFDSETTGEPGLTYYGGDYDFTGYDDTTRRIPRRLSAAIETGNRIVAGPDFTPAEVQAIGRDFVNANLNLLQRTDEVQGDFSIDLSAGDRFNFGDFDLGVIAVFGYDNSWQSRSGLQEGEPVIENGNIRPTESFEFGATQNDVVVNALLGLGLRFGDHRIDWTNFYVHSTTKEARSRAGFSSPAGRTVRDDFTEWFERSLINTQLTGTHEFNRDAGDIEIQWRAAYAKTTRDAPYENRIRYVLNEQLNRFAYDPSGSGSFNTRQFSEVEDELASGGADFIYTIPLSERRDIVLRAGFSLLDNQRQAEQRIFSFITARPLTLPETVQRVDFLFSDFNIRPDLFSLRELTGSQGAAAYDAELQVFGAYVQADAEIFPLVRVSAGLRYEDGEQSVLPRDLFGDGGGDALLTPTLIQETYWLPSATLTWNFAEDMQLRLGASMTIARPQFRELAPQTFQDVESDRLFIGNPFLTDSELINLDARYEWYFERGEYITAGVFYKDIENPVESLITTTGVGLLQTFLNAPRATIYGFEVEGRTYVDIPENFRPGFLSDSARLFATANYTYTNSEVSAEAGDTVRALTGGGAPQPATDLVQDGSRLQGQSDHLFNLQVGIDDRTNRTQATFLVNYVSERISARGILGVNGAVVQPDFIQDPGVTLDFVLRQGFTFRDQEFTIGVEARNLTGEDFEEYQEFGAGRVNLNTYDLGTTLSVSLSARF